MMARATVSPPTPESNTPMGEPGLGPRAARRYWLTAERFGVAEALRYGLLHDAAPAAELDAAVAAVVAAVVVAVVAAVASGEAVGSAADLGVDRLSPSLGESLAEKEKARIRVSPVTNKSDHVCRLLSRHCEPYRGHRRQRYVRE